MCNDEGYFNATRDEMRVFGVCIKGYNCRVQEAMRLRTLVEEVLVPLRCSDIKDSLTANLGSWYNFDYYGRNKRQRYAQAQAEAQALGDSDTADVDNAPAAADLHGMRPEEKAEVDRSKPIFVHLEFSTHEEAWRGFELLDNAFRAGQSDLKVSWVKSEWYWVVAKKARELSFTTSPKSARSLEKEIERLSAGNDAEPREK